MGVIDTVKEMGTLIQKLDNLDLLKRMVELQEQVSTLVTENRDVRDENRVLRDRLSTRDQMAFRDNAYWKGEEGPYCLCCFDAEGLAMRMLVGKGYYPSCPKCKTVARDPNAELPRPLKRVGRSSYLERERAPRF
jgi:hypothetical protein